MHSAVFAVCLSVCLSVCPSLVHCIETAKLTMKLFSSSGAWWPRHSSFPTRDQTVKFRRGNHQQGCRIEVGYQQFAIFNQSHCISETMKDRAIVTTER